MRGITFVELLLVLVLIGLVTAVATPSLGRAVHRLAVREGAERYASVHHAARVLAVARGRLARIELDSSAHRATIALLDPSGAWDTVDVRSLGPARMTFSRGTVTFSPLGIGWGASNTRIVFSSGTAADTLVVARTGRLRRS